jgi:benzoylformate decarboxylase
MRTKATSKDDETYFFLASDMTGIEAFLEILAGAGVCYLFGNPGTTELPLNDALAKDSRFQYILGVQEIPAVAAADGYAQASGRIGVVNVHICPGVGNAMGMLYNAHVAGTPLLLTAGQQDRRLLLQEPVLVGDLISVTRPWTKWSYEVQRVEDIPTATRRAIQTALKPPTGPVFLSLPLDVQMQSSATFDLVPPSPARYRTRPTVDDLQAVVELLAQAKSPAILAGSRVMEAGGAAALVEIAESLGAPVFAESATNHGRLPFPPAHPLYAGPLPLWSPEVLQRLSPHDVFFVVGMPLFRQYIHFDGPGPLPEGSRIVQLDSDPWQLDKNYPAAAALYGDIRLSLLELAPLLNARLDTRQKKQAQLQVEEAGKGQEARRQELLQTAEGQLSRRPMTPLTMMTAIARALPRNVAVIEEAVTSTNNVLEKLGAIHDPSGYFGHRGWALGWGLGCALGVKLAWPDRPVLALLGEGSALYGIQGLWTATHYNIPVTFVICNNAQYQILKVCAGVLPLPQMAAKNYLGMDLRSPEIDFVQLAQSFGVDAHRVTEPEELADRVRTSLTSNRPMLFDVPLSSG